MASKATLTVPASPPRSSGSRTAAKFTSPVVDVRIGPQHFDLLKLIGEGAFGKVLLVRNCLNRELYAMKVISKALLKKKNNYLYMKSERDILAKIYHPFVVSLYFAFQSKTKIFLVMDFLAGGELFFHLRRRGIIMEREVRFYVGEIVLALEFLHLQGVIHRDLKPENVLLRGDGHVCITDFGLAKEIGEGHSRTLCGTSEYMAPEMLTRNGYGKAVDWWAMGALAYEMLCGSPPFTSKNQKELDRKILSERLSVPPYLTSCTHSLLRGLLEKDATRRLGCAKSTMFAIGGVAALKGHAFFDGLDWDRLEKLELAPPINLLETSYGYDSRVSGGAASPNNEPTAEEFVARHTEKLAAQPTTAAEQGVPTGRLSHHSVDDYAERRQQQEQQRHLTMGGDNDEDGSKAFASLAVDLPTDPFHCSSAGLQQEGSGSPSRAAARRGRAGSLELFDMTAGEASAATAASLLGTQPGSPPPLPPRDSPRRRARSGSVQLLESEFPTFDAQGEEAASGDVMTAPITLCTSLDESQLFMDESEPASLGGNASPASKSVGGMGVLSLDRITAYFESDFTKQNISQSVLDDALTRSRSSTMNATALVDADGGAAGTESYDFLDGFDYVDKRFSVTADQLSAFEVELEKKIAKAAKKKSFKNKKEAEKRAKDNMLAANAAIAAQRVKLHEEETALAEKRARLLDEAGTRSAEAIRRRVRFEEELEQHGEQESRVSKRLKAARKKLRDVIELREKLATLPTIEAAPLIPTAAPPSKSGGKNAKVAPKKASVPSTKGAFPITPPTGPTKEQLEKLSRQPDLEQEISDLEYELRDLNKLVPAAPESAVPELQAALARELSAINAECDSLLQDIKQKQSNLLQSATSAPCDPNQIQGMDAFVVSVEGRLAQELDKQESAVSVKTAGTDTTTAPVMVPVCAPLSSASVSVPVPVSAPAPKVEHAAVALAPAPSPTKTPWRSARVQAALNAEKAAIDSGGNSPTEGIRPESQSTGPRLGHGHSAGNAPRSGTAAGLPAPPPAQTQPWRQSFAPALVRPSLAAAVPPNRVEAGSMGTWASKAAVSTTAANTVSGGAWGKAGTPPVLTTPTPTLPPHLHPPGCECGDRLNSGSVNKQELAEFTTVQKVDKKSKPQQPMSYRAAANSTRIVK